MILDASALLAYLQQEPGSSEVELILPTALISTVNWCEVAQKLQARLIDDQEILKNLKILGLQTIPFQLEHAKKAAELWQITSTFGLSLEDRACLATGIIEKIPVITADQVWKQLPLPLEIKLLR
ncbi:twitching motility protein PilT [Achromatium sp. WMS3]|nr:twitching motility protein PilT [Achromatium sp. WMS3]